LVLIAQAIFLLERGQTDRQTDRRVVHHIYAGGIVGVGISTVLVSVDPIMN